MLIRADSLDLDVRVSLDDFVLLQSYHERRSISRGFAWASRSELVNRARPTEGSVNPSHPAIGTELRRQGASKRSGRSEICRMFESCLNGTKCHYPVLVRGAVCYHALELKPDGRLMSSTLA